ncbi:hypothetical protein V6N11_073504 [Hibiscus sabdariffa]|uniref:Uncharacterized protein n=1 Tax=Hibiscus sabdariffa TaxID=183260 RepID=A0ABR2NTM6_9ROSI
MFPHFLFFNSSASDRGGSACWLHVSSLQRTFALDILEFILSNYVVMFKILVLYEHVVKNQSAPRRSDRPPSLRLLQIIDAT